MHVLWVWPGLGGCGLEEQTAHFLLFLDEDFKVLIDDGHCQQDTCTTANGTWREGRERERDNNTCRLLARFFDLVCICATEEIGLITGTHP